MWNQHIEYMKLYGVSIRVGSDALGAGGRPDQREQLILLHCPVSARLACGIQSSCGDLLQPVLVVQSAEHCLASENVPCRKAMTMAAHRRRWSDRVGNAWTKTAVNSRVIVIGDPVRKEPFQMPLAKRDQEIQALPPDRPH